MDFTAAFVNGPEAASFVTQRSNGQRMPIFPGSIRQPLDLARPRREMDA
jgi:hypothetical protein